MPMNGLTKCTRHMRGQQPCWKWWEKNIIINVLKEGSRKCNYQCGLSTTIRPLWTTGQRHCRYKSVPVVGLVILLVRWPSKKGFNKCKLKDWLAWIQHYYRSSVVKAIKLYIRVSTERRLKSELKNRALRFMQRAQVICPGFVFRHCCSTSPPYSFLVLENWEPWLVMEGR